MVFITLFLSLLTGIYAPFKPAFAEVTPLTATLTSPRSAHTEYLSWSPERRLTWDDFKAAPDQKNSHHALTAANLSVDAKCKNNHLEYEVKSVFLQAQSWTKNKKSEKLLYHEQLHFDLTEVHARQLRQKLSELGTTCNGLQSRMEPAVTEAFQKWKAEQATFDKLSRHGLNAEVQREWAATIELRLQELEEFK